MHHLDLLSDSIKLIIKYLDILRTPGGNNNKKTIRALQSSNKRKKQKKTKIELHGPPVYV